MGAAFDEVNSLLYVVDRQLNQVGGMSAHRTQLQSKGETTRRELSSHRCPVRSVLACL